MDRLGGVASYLSVTMYWKLFQTQKEKKKKKTLLGILRITFLQEMEVISIMFFYFYLVSCIYFVAQLIQMRMLLNKNCCLTKTTSYS